MKRPRGVPPSVVGVRCAAKVNLGWRVGDLRDDGFHDVEGVMQTVSLTDSVEIRCSHAGDVDGDVVVEVGGVPVALRVDGPEASDELRSEGNLALRAAELSATFGLPRPTSIALTKHIPRAAGLGGGSADAAGVLTGLALAWGARVNARELLRAAATLGSDVPAIVVGGLVHASGRGERVRSIGDLTPTAFVLGVSDATLETAAVYRRLDELREAGEATGIGCPSNALEAAAISLEPSIADGLEAMRSAGCPVAVVCGSGPTVAGIAPNEEAARAVVDRLRGRFRRVEVCTATASGVDVRISAETDSGHD